MSDTLDLDSLAPEPKKVKLNGKLYDLYPARLNDFIAIQKLFFELRDSSSDKQLKAIGRFHEVLKPIVPSIEEMNLSLPQLMTLLKFSYTEASNDIPVEKKTPIPPSQT